MVFYLGTRKFWIDQDFRIYDWQYDVYNVIVNLIEIKLTLLNRIFTIN